MRQSIATILVAYAGFTLLPYALASSSGIVAGQWQPAVPLLLLGVLGIFLIAQRRRVAAWVIGDAQDDGTAMALGLVRALGLLLVTGGVEQISTLFYVGGMPAEMRVNLALQTGFLLAKLVLGFFALAKPGAFVTVLDTPERPLGETITADVIFGAVAVWVLLTAIPSLAQAVTRFAQESARGDLEMRPTSALWTIALPEVVAGLVAVSLGLWAFFGRARLARIWYRIHPMGEA